MLSNLLHVYRLLAGVQKVIYYSLLSRATLRSITSVSVVMIWPLVPLAPSNVLT